MVKIRYFSEDLNIQSKTVVLRLDLNVPLKEKKIQDNTRIILNLPFIKKLVMKNIEMELNKQIDNDEIYKNDLYISTLLEINHHSLN